MKSLTSILLAIGFFLTGYAAQAAAYENDNSHSTRDAAVFFQKLDNERGN